MSKIMLFLIKAELWHSAVENLGLCLVFPQLDHSIYANEHLLFASE